MTANLPDTLPAFTKQEALRHVESLKAAFEAMHEAVTDMLLEAHERRAHVALGYASWEVFVETEFGMSRRNAGYILDRGRLAHAITAESEGGNAFPPSAISTRDAQALKPDPSAPREIAAAVDGGEEPATAVKKAAAKRAPKKAKPVVIPARSRLKDPPFPQASAARLAQMAEVLCKAASLKLKGNEVALTIADRDERRAVSRWLHSFSTDFDRETHGYPPLQRSTVTPRFKGGAEA